MAAVQPQSISKHTLTDMKISQVDRDGSFSVKTLHKKGKQLKRTCQHDGLGNIKVKSNIFLDL